MIEDFWEWTGSLLTGQQPKVGAIDMIRVADGTMVKREEHQTT